MSHQAYSAESFLEVYDLDNRNGVNKDKEFFPNVHRANLRIDRKARAIRNFYKKHRSQSSKLNANRKEQARKLFKNLKTEKKRKREILTRELQRISEITSKKSFSVSLHQGFANGKPTYTHGPTPEEYYALKQTAINIRRIYRVKQSSRNAICSQIHNMITDGYKYHIVRADIKSFYESVPQKSLIGKLEFDSLLSIKSRRILKQVLETYAAANGGTTKGIPRGVNVSADLAELYMRDLDEKIKQIEGVCFYARYVDDIIVFFAQPKHLESQPRLPRVSHVINSFGLEINEEKTYEASISKKPNLEYLGYVFHCSGENSKVALSQKKMDRYHARLIRTLKDYQRDKSINEKRAYRSLLARLHFLTGNTQLSNAKRNAHTGIYFSNPILTDLSQLRDLDMVLSLWAWRELSTKPTLKSEVNKLSFEVGFMRRRMVRFNRHKKPGDRDEMNKIVRAWSYAEKS